MLRSSALALLLCLLVGLVWPVAVAAQDEPPRSDLPATLLRPGDLDANGLDGFVAGVGATGGDETLSRFNALYRGGGTVPVIGRDGMVAGSTLFLIRATDLDLPSPDRVISSVSVYDDEDAATDALETLIADRSGLDGATAEPAADDGVATITVAGNDPFGAASYRQVSALGVVGSVVVEAAIEFTGGADASTDEAVDLFEVVSERLDESDDGYLPGGFAPDLIGDDIVPDLSRYVVFDGEPVSVAGLDTEAVVARAELFAGYGADQVFEFSYRSTDGAITVGGYLSAHDDEAGARDYAGDILSILRSDDGLVNVRTGNAIVRVGDGGTLVSYGLADDATTVVTELVVRFGALVIELIVNAPEEIAAADMTALGEAIAACVEDDDCGPIVVPDDVGLRLD